MSSILRVEESKQGTSNSSPRKKKRNQEDQSPRENLKSNIFLFFFYEISAP
jgi:hypothetical protein